MRRPADFDNEEGTQPHGKKKHATSLHGKFVNRARAVALLLVSIVLATIVGELSLRWYANINPSVLFFRPNAGVVESLEGVRYPAGMIRHGYPVNGRGHYDEEFHPRPTDRRVVASIGDSFSAGVVHHYFHFTTVAERNLENITVFNYGLPAIDIPQYQYLLVTEVLRSQPDLILVNIFVGNDLSFPLPKGTSPAEDSNWFDVENLLMIQVPKRLLILARQSREARIALDDRQPARDTPEILHKRPEILRKYPWYVDPRGEPPTLDRARFLEIERNRAAQLVRQPKAGFEVRLEMLNEMRRQAGGVPMAVMIIPDVFQIEDLLWDEIAPPGADKRRRMRSVHITRRWLEANDFPCLDLLPVLRSVKPLEDGRRHLYKLTDTHFNARGNLHAGKALARFIDEFLTDPDP